MDEDIDIGSLDVDAALDYECQIVEALGEADDVDQRLDLQVALEDVRARIEEVSGL